MEVGRIQQNLATKNRLTQQNRLIGANVVTGADSISFQGFGSEATKRSWYFLRRLSDEMRNVSEITNALIAAIGTGIIAPAIILVSPGKNDQEDKDKKFLQAIRQPLSALLQLAFQVPATMAINKFINKLAYKDNIKLFQDETLGSLIPDKPYLYDNIKSSEIEAWEARFDDTTNGTSLRQKLEAQIRQDYEEVGLSVSDDKIAKQVEKRKRKFIKFEIVEDKYKKLMNAKVEELKASGRDFGIQDKHLVTDDYRQLAILRNKDAYNALEDQVDLRWYDKVLKNMGFGTKRTKQLDQLQKNFANEKGLELLKEECGDIFNDSTERLRRFVENHQKDAKKAFGNKKFWISLGINLFMVTASCYALNWAHPRLKEWIDKRKAEKAEQQQIANNNQKVEVK